MVTIGEISERRKKKENDQKGSEKGSIRKIKFVPIFNQSYLRRPFEKFSGNIFGSVLFYLYFIYKRVF